MRSCSEADKYKDVEALRDMRDARAAANLNQEDVTSIFYLQCNILINYFANFCLIKFSV